MTENPYAAFREKHLNQEASAIASDIIRTAEVFIAQPGPKDSMRVSLLVPGPLSPPDLPELANRIIARLPPWLTAHYLPASQSPRGAELHIDIDHSKIPPRS